MKSCGIILLVLGALIALGAWLMPTSISVDQPSYLSGTTYSLGTSTQNVINIGKLQMQMMVFQTGCVLFLAGIGLFAGGVLEERLSGSGSQQRNEQAAIEPAETSHSPVQDWSPPEASSSEKNGLLLVGGAILLIVVIGLLFAFNNPTRESAEAAATEANAEALADNIEAQADALDALADNAATGR